MSENYCTTKDLGKAFAIIAFFIVGVPLLMTPALAADKAFKDAEAQLDVNYFEQLGISKTPYENQRNAITQASAQAMEVAKESDRGGAATAGRVLAQSNLAQKNITDQQTKDLEALNKLVATEESKLGTSRANLSLSQAEGAGIASAQAQNAANQSIAQGIQGLGNMAMMGLEASELYGSDGTGDTDNTGDTNNTLVSNNTDSFGVFASDANTYPQVVPSQNMSLPTNLPQQYPNTYSNYETSQLLYNPFKLY